MTLTRKVSFQGIMEKGNRIQIPKIILWEFKVETNQTLNVSVNAKDIWHSWQSFYTKIDKQGRIHVPKLTLTMLATNENLNLAGYIFDVTIQPAQ